MHVTPCMCGSQRTTCNSWSSPSGGPRDPAQVNRLGGKPLYSLNDSIVFKHLHVKESYRSLSLQFLIDKQRTNFENSFKNFILETVYWVLSIEELGVRQTP